MAQSDDVRPAFDVGQFARTIVRLESDAGWIDIVPQTTSAGGGWGVAEPVYVISGCNPGYRAADDVNERRHGHLEQRLRELGYSPRPALGRAPDESWTEPSWAVVGPTRDEACAIGQEFDQVAVFEVDSQRIQVVRCADRTPMSSSPYSVVRVK